MAIMFRCSCGKTMQAREEFGGKKVKCGDCGAVLLIPHPGGSRSAPAEPELPPVMRESREEVQAGPPPTRSGSSTAYREPRWDPEAKKLQEPYRERHGLAGWMKAVLVLLVLGAIGGGGYMLLSSYQPAVKGPGKKTPTRQLTLVPADATGFATLKIAELWNHKALEKVRDELARLDEESKRELSHSFADVERVTLVLSEKDWNLKDPDFSPEFWIIVHMNKPLQEAKLKRLVDGVIEKEHRGKKYLTSKFNDKTAVYFAGEKEVWIGAHKALLELMDGTRKISAEGPLADAIELATADEHQLVFSFTFPQSLKDRLRETPRMPPEFEPLREFQSALAAFNASRGDELELKLAFGKEVTAQQTADLASKFVESAKNSIGLAPPDAEPFKTLGRMLEETRIDVKGSEVSIRVPRAVEAVASLARASFEGKKLSPKKGKAFPKDFDKDLEKDFEKEGKKAAEPKKSSDDALLRDAVQDLRNLVLAMHAYQDVNKSLPPANFRKGLSWRVALLPYLDQKALYDQFNLDESWDSPHNLKLLDRMPAVFMPMGPVPGKKGYTCYQVVTGDKLLFHSRLDLKSKLFLIPDGSSNTALMFEAERLVPWTAPEDIVYEPFAKQPMPALGHQRPGTFLVGMGDGEVYRFSTRMDQETLDRLIHPRDALRAEVEPYLLKK